MITIDLVGLGLSQGIVCTFYMYYGQSYYSARHLLYHCGTLIFVMYRGKSQTIASSSVLTDCTAELSFNTTAAMPPRSSLLLTCYVWPSDGLLVGRCNRAIKTRLVRADFHIRKARSWRRVRQPATRWRALSARMSSSSIRHP
jgi:hypothetical protein